MFKALIVGISVFGVSATSGCDLMRSSSVTKTDTIIVQVIGDKATPTDFTVNKGDTVKLTITTDKDEEVHLHGYDIHFDGKAGTPLEKTFTADKTGQFEYEIEASATHLGNLTVNP
ncbi:MAG: hypothetical protein QOK05_870 [Chloroflexota bacterium]|jgi:FtsP/CotA-like multicopper oxidase with cupredoxin domain|nr:hypothetical protein [Chloroflexota bacterium]